MSKVVDAIIDGLSIHHPNPKCELNFNSEFELLVAVILSAQCTDKRVNIITPSLFDKYNTPEQFAVLTEEELQPYIFSCGFYRNKAKNIISASRSIVDKYNGIVPNRIGELLTLDGIGNKTANVIYSVAFGGQAIAVDTHVFRVSRRIGLASGKTPDKVMFELMQVCDESKWSRLHHLLIHHGRYVCIARKPKCEICEIKAYCNYYKKNIKGA